VCKTCSDYKHVCLGYSESTANLRSQSDSTSRAPAPLAGQRDPNSQHNSRAVESSSPELQPRSLHGLKPDKSPQVPKQFESKDVSLLRDTSAGTNKETDSQAAVDTPESSKAPTEWLPSLPNFHVEILTSTILLRSYLFELQQPHPCTVFQIFRAHSHRAWVQADGLVTRAETSTTCIY